MPLEELVRKNLTQVLKRYDNRNALFRYMRTVLVGTFSLSHSVSQSPILPSSLSLDVYPPKEEQMS